MAADPILAALTGEAAADPETIGLLLHDSRALGRERLDSDYDVIWVLAQPAYDARSEREQLLERREGSGAAKIAILYSSLARLEWAAANPGWYTAADLSAAVSGQPANQQRLKERVEALMSSRGVQHEWGGDLEPLKALRFEELS